MWFPMIDEDKCDGCEITRGKKFFEDIHDLNKMVTFKVTKV